MSETNTTIPRWAREAAAALKAKPDWLWERINELLMDGFDTPDVMRELGLPESKMRSLQVYAQRFGPRRRLVQWARFKDALLDGGVAMSGDIAAAMSSIARYAVSDKVPPNKQMAACDLMNQFVRTLARLMKTDEIAEVERYKDEAQQVQVDPEEAVRRIMDLYGIKPDGGSPSGGSA